MFIRRIALLISFAALSVKAAHASSDWLADELLRQLQEMRAEVKALRDDVSGLREDISHLQPRQDTSLGKSDKAGLLSTSGEPHFGSADAQLVIVEFSDFECPFCTRHNKQTWPQIRDTFVETGQVQYVMKDFPLEFHAKATDAAMAGYCANEQGRYEGMRNALFENPRSLGRDFYMRVAKSEQLDAAKFAQCLDSVAARQEVEADLAEGMALGVTGTPTFFIGRVVNGTVTDTKMITGAVGFDRFRQVLEGYLQ